MVAIVVICGCLLIIDRGAEITKASLLGGESENLLGLAKCTCTYLTEF